MSELIHCPVCEGWGVISYDQNGVPNPCERCSGSGQVEPPPPAPTAVYSLTHRQAAVKEVLDLAQETTNSNNAEARELAELVVKLFDDFDLIEAEEF